MPLRALNDTVIVLPDGELLAVDDNQNVLDAIKSGLILLPEKNQLMKLSNTATVVSRGPKCKYDFKEGDRIYYDQFFDKPMWHEVDGFRYRIILEHYIRAVICD
jgi:co-chaperonin GroES (HSP10)